MKISHFNNNSLTFKGIYGTATKLDENGKKEEVKINLEGNTASLKVMEDPHSFSALFPRNSITLLTRNEPGIGPFKDFEKGETYNNITIDRVDGNSCLILKKPGYTSVKTLADNAMMRVSGGSGCELGKSDGENTSITLEKGAKLSVEDLSTFYIKTSNLYNQVAGSKDKITTQGGLLLEG